MNIIKLEWYNFNYDINSKDPIKIQCPSGASVLVAKRSGSKINKSLIKDNESGLWVQSHNNVEWIGVFAFDNHRKVYTFGNNKNG